LAADDRRRRSPARAHRSRHARGVGLPRVAAVRRQRRDPLHDRRGVLMGVLRAILRVLRHFLATIVWTLLFAVLLVLSFLHHAELPVARRVARDLLNQAASAPIRGALLVNRFDQLDDEKIVARHVMLFDGDGRRIVVADQLTLVPAPGTLGDLL